ncbi:MAG: Gfo/Idh/MocA family oxidoreductase, partial [Verrucomicrobiota bacterium]
MKTSRRSFMLKTAAAPLILTGPARSRAAANERINVGMIGMGNQGMNDIRNFLADERVQVVAICDVNRESPGYWANKPGGYEVGRRLVERTYAQQNKAGAFKGCDTMTDFREMLARPDIDAVEVVTPDHWHGIMVTEAAAAGKDIYAQKPLSLTIPQGRAMSDAVRRYARVCQVGTQRRSDAACRRGCELVRNGRIGRLVQVECGLPRGTPDYVGKGTGNRWKPEPVPDGFDYRRWLGPAPDAPYAPARCHVNFRWILDYSGGQVTDFGAHFVDIAQWGMGTETTGPVKIQNARGTWADHPLWNTASSFYFECIYANGVKLVVADHHQVRIGVT